MLATTTRLWPTTIALARGFATVANNVSRGKCAFWSASRHYESIDWD